MGIFVGFYGLGQTLEDVLRGPCASSALKIFLFVVKNFKNLKSLSFVGGFKTQFLFLKRKKNQNGGKSFVSPVYSQLLSLFSSAAVLASSAPVNKHVGKKLSLSLLK